MNPATRHTASAFQRRGSGSVSSLTRRPLPAAHSPDAHTTRRPDREPEVPQPNRHTEGPLVQGHPAAPARHRRRGGGHRPRPRRGIARHRRKARRHEGRQGEPQHEGAEERHLPARRRHGRLRDHGGALLPVRRGRPDERRPAPVHRLRHDVVGQAGRRPGPPPRLRPRLRVHRHDVGDGPEDHRRADLPGPEHGDRRARREPPDRPRARPEGGQEDRQRLDGGDHRRDACSPRIAHVAARLPGPGGHGRGLQDRDEGRRRPRLDRRADGRPQGRRHARRRPRALRAEDRRRPDRRRLREGAGLRRRRGRHGARGGRRLQAAARALQREQHDDRVERPAGHARRRARLHRRARPATGRRTSPASRR